MIDADRATGAARAASVVSFRRVATSRSSASRGWQPDGFEHAAQVGDAGRVIAMESGAVDEERADADRLGAGDVVVDPIADVEGVRGFDAERVEGPPEDRRFRFLRADDRGRDDDVEVGTHSQASEERGQRRRPIRNHREPDTRAAKSLQHRSRFGKHGEGLGAAERGEEIARERVEVARETGARGDVVDEDAKPRFGVAEVSFDRSREFVVRPRHEATDRAAVRDVSESGERRGVDVAARGTLGEQRVPGVEEDGSNGAHRHGTYQSAMNRILLEARERIDGMDRFAITGARADHVRNVLRSEIGDSLAVGLRDGPRGRGVVVATADEGVTIDVFFAAETPRRGRIDLLVAMPRPKAWKRLLSQVAQFDVARVCVVNAARVEKPYFSTQYLAPEHYGPLLDDGLMQAGRTSAPAITIEPLFRPFVEDRLDGWLGATRRFVLDPSAEGSLMHSLEELSGAERVALAIGPDTGFVPFEIGLLRHVGFSRVRLTDSILRTDTATVAALGAVSSFLDRATNSAGPP